MKKSLFFFTFISFFFLSIPLSASHYLGGEITWECAKSGPNAGKFRFHVKLYRDCGSDNSDYMPPVVQLSTNAPIGSINCPQVGGNNDVSPNCYDPAGEIACDQVTSGKGAVEERIYRSGWVTINGVPPTTGWWFAFGDCCRPSTTTNIAGNQGYTLRAIMYPYLLNGVPQNTSPCYDSSPTFLEPPKTVICTGYKYTYSHNAFDVDLDSTTYEWAQSLGQTGSIVYPQAPVNYTAPYTFNNPLPNATGAPVTIDAVTGAISFTPNVGGSFATCVKVSSYRCGQLIAEIYRDIPVVLKNDCAPNDPPSLNMTNYPNFPQLVPLVVGGDTIGYETTVFAGEEVKFSLVAQDIGTIPVSFLPQSITFEPSGGQLGSPLSSDSTGCLNPPCATIIPVPGQSGFVSYLNNGVIFDWKTSCDHLSYQATQCGSPTNVYTFVMRMQDNFCPAPAISIATIKITVISYIPVPPDLSMSCASVVNNDVHLDWDVPADTGNNFEAYIIYHSNSASGPFNLVDTIFDYNQLQYIHNGITSGYYYLTTLGGCMVESIPSDTISVIDLTLSPWPAVNSSVAQLNWIGGNPNSQAPYEIWRQSSNGIWEMLDTTSNLVFNDTVNVCGDTLVYQIRQGSCTSNLKDGYFSDRTNNDVLPIDSVSVSGNSTLIAWPPSSKGDVIDYLVLKYIAGTGWVTIDTVPVGTPMPYVTNTIDPSSEIGQFKIVSLDSCGNQSSDLLVEYHNNMLLTDRYDPCEDIMHLKWNAYHGWPEAISAYQIMADVTPPGGATQTGVLLGTNAGTDSTFDMRNLLNGYEYCFYVMAVNATGTVTSTSNVVCINSLSIQHSRILYLARTTVKEDESIETMAYIDKDADVVNFTVQRAEAKGGVYMNLAVIPKPQTAPWNIKFTDTYVHPQDGSYIYRILSTDSCGGIDTISNIGQSIHLTATADQSLANQLIWNKYREFGGLVGRYEVYRSRDEGLNWTLVTNQLRATDTSYLDDIRSFGDGTGIFYYKVVAVETANPLGIVAEDGGPMKSTSNIAQAQQKPRMFLPNVFNPNSEIPANRIFKPSNLYISEIQYQMTIYNRWGIEVFSTTDLDTGWDGNIDGKPAPIGVYMFTIKYTSKEGLAGEEKGSITLLR